MIATVLAIQSEPGMGRVLERGLSPQGLAVDSATDGAQGITAARGGGYEAVLLDLLLPGCDGFEVLAEIRDAKPILPVIVLTALSGVENRVRGLEAGAVDYVVKPFSLRELAARIHAQLRQVGIAQSPCLSRSGIDVDLMTRTASHHGVSVHLTTMEFRLLVYLMQQPGIVHTRREILNEVWGRDLESRKNLVDVYVGYLRRKLQAQAPDRVMPIQTVRSVGYRFVDMEAKGAASELPQPA